MSAQAPTTPAGGPEARSRSFLARALAVATARGSRSFESNPTEWLMAAALLILWIYLTLFAPYFLTGSNVVDVLQRAALSGIVAVGQTMVMIGAGIDLSVGSIFGLAGVLGAMVMVSSGIALGVLVALGVGLALGTMNGLLVSYLRLAPFVVTLAMLSLARSWDYVVTNSTSVTGVPIGFGVLANNKIVGIPLFVFLMAAIYLIAHVLLSRSRFGRFLYAIGTNEEAARLAGVRVRRYKVVPYMIAGLLAGVAALVSVSQLLSIDPNAGTGMELETIAAVVIGGTSLFGGKGSMVGTLIGTLFVASLANGLNLLGVSPFWQGTAVGGVLLLAISLQSLFGENSGGRGGGGFTSARRALRSAVRRSRPKSGSLDEEPSK